MPSFMSGASTDQGGGTRRLKTVSSNGIEYYYRQIQCLKGGDHAYTLRSADVLRAFDRHRGFTGNRM
jgi:hypothetical protein